MARYYLKPVFWNTAGYRRPSGVAATGGYPAERGYGHEEWNNADFMGFEDRAKRFRAFHAQGVGNARIAENDGQIFLFMYASHDGLQQLVGVAGKATCLAREDCRDEREDLVDRLGIRPRWREVWDLQIVKDLHDNDRKKFKRLWDKDVSGLPNWKCPEDLFFWPKAPITLDPRRITGMARLLGMFSGHTEIGPDAANRVMASVPAEARNTVWHRIRDEIDAIDAAFDEAIADVEDIKAKEKMRATTKETLINARLGQGDFRAGLMKRWNAACAVTGCNQPEVLRASHIKPWKPSDNRDRLNPRNGLLLSANLDALFDKGLISFQDNGTMMISTQVSELTRSLLGLPARLRKQLNDEEKGFLTFHRDTIFLP